MKEATPPTPIKFLWVGVCARKYKEILSFSFETSKLTMKKKKEKKKKMKVAEVGWTITSAQHPKEEVFEGWVGGWIWHFYFRLVD